LRTSQTHNAASASADWKRPGQFLNRDLSWLDFDQRVLELAVDPGLPLLERVKFCSIVSSNLDEFFAVRMAWLERQVASGVVRRSPDGRTAMQSLEEARAAILALQDDQDRLWLDDLLAGLAAEAIRICSVEECSPGELRSLNERFDREILPLLTPIAVSAAAPFPRLPSLGLAIGAIVKDSFSDPQRFVCVSVPRGLPRFLEVGTGGTRVAVDDAILHFLPHVTGGEVEASAAFRITRDAELAVADDAEDLLEAVEHELLRRRFGEVVRLETDANAKPELVERLKAALAIDTRHVYTTRAPLGLADVIQLQQARRPALKHRPWRPVTPHSLANRDPAGLLTRIRRRDLLVHHPYDSFDSSVQAFVAAARDPDTLALKATVYRTGDPSPTLDSLAKTAEENKEAVALVELKARFDERCNIEWARALDRAGVNVVYGVPNLKVHTKLAMLVRHERDSIRRYVHIGTGNYHASNASNYEDLSLFTADTEIAADVADVFNAVTGLVKPKAFRKLLVGPWFLRDGLLGEIDRVTRAARAGETARIRIKVNSLVDPAIIDALYAASSAGATIQIITRGICALRPGVSGLSERITVRSVLGRFLEHSRILSFTASDRTTTWIGSADLMPRNLDRRIEVLAPVEDVRLRADIDVILDALLADTRSSWQLHSNGNWRRTTPAVGFDPVSAQEALMARALKRTKPRRAQVSSSLTRRRAA
jgi:polyphosphate kinase